MGIGGVSAVGQKPRCNCLACDCHCETAADPLNAAQELGTFALHSRAGGEKKNNKKLNWMLEVACRNLGVRSLEMVSRRQIKPDSDRKPIVYLSK